MYNNLLDLIDFPLNPPKCDYQCITMSWPFTDYDTCIFKHEGCFEKEHHTHFYISEHTLIFLDIRLWKLILKLVKDKIILSKL